jgi:hypothetical protein
MRVPLRLAISVILLVVGSSGAFALQNQELIEKSGVEQQVRELQRGVSNIDNLKQQGVPIDEKFEKAWAEAVPTAYQADKILAVVDQGLEKLLTKEEKSFLLDHYASPLGKRITDLEIQASKAELQDEIQANAQKLMADPNNADRIALYGEIDKACGATSIAVEMAMNVALAMSIGLASAAEGPKEVDIESIRAELEKQRPALTQQITGDVLEAFAFAYKDLKTEELNSYLDFLKSPTARKFNVGTAKLISETLTTQSHELGRLLGQILARKAI